MTEKNINSPSFKRTINRLRLLFQFGWYSFFNFICPKRNHIAVLAGERGNPKRKQRNNKRNAVKVEDNAIVLANYLAEHYDIKIYFIALEEFESFSNIFLNKKIRFVKRRTAKAFFILISSKFLFFTHQGYITKSSRKQKLINLWHGVGHKKIVKLKGTIKGINADYTLVTSELIKDKFSKAFGISKSSTIMAGYPRNDILIKAQYEIKNKVRKTFDLDGYDKILIWMPTFRTLNKLAFDESDVFGIHDFDLKRFQDLLHKHNSICLVKPHHQIRNFSFDINLENIKVIDDFWVNEKGYLLYQFLGSTDALITDFSSVMIDYSLLNNPIFCVATDLQEYKQSGNLYFEDFENWIPTEFHNNQETFFIDVEDFLRNNKDKYVDKRNSIKNLYFRYQDNESCKRIAQEVFHK